LANAPCPTIQIFMNDLLIIAGNFQSAMMPNFRGQR